MRDQLVWAAECQSLGGWGGRCGGFLWAPPSTRHDPSHQPWGPEALNLNLCPQQPPARFHMRLTTVGLTPSLRSWAQPQAPGTCGKCPEPGSSALACLAD